MLDFPKDPGSSLSCAACHRSLCSRIVQHSSGFKRVCYVAIRDNRNGNHLPYWQNTAILPGSSNQQTPVAWVWSKPEYCRVQPVRQFVHSGGFLYPTLCGLLALTTAPGSACTARVQLIYRAKVLARYFSARYLILLPIICALFFLRLYHFIWRVSGNLYHPDILLISVSLP